MRSSYGDPLIAFLAFALALPAAPAQNATPLEDRFERFDLDRNGEISPGELRAPGLFARLDRNEDGFLSRQEVALFRPNRPQPDSAPVEPAPASPFEARPHGDEALAAGLDPTVLGRIDQHFEQAIRAREVSGIVALIERTGATGYFETFGWQDIEAEKPMPKDAIFRLQSMSKPVVAAAALTLFDEGRFTLDEPISKHLTEWTEPEVLENGQLVPARHAITPRMLMTHSCGLYYGRLPGASSSGRVIGQDEPVTLETHSKSLASQPLKYHPGEGFSYGTSIDVLGRYLEVVTGKPLDEVVRERILDPLQMTDTDFWVHPEKANRIVQIYRQPGPGQLVRGREAEQLTHKPTIFLGGQGLCSPTEDYARFCRMMLSRGELEGVRVLKAETVDLMFQNHLADIGENYGLGGAVKDGGYAWGGANGTQFWIDRPNDLFAIFMVQTQRYRAPTVNGFRLLVKEAIQLKPDQTTP